MSPDRIAVVHGDREQTYGELHDRATRMAHVLAGLGVESGDRVAYLGPNEPAFLETLFGAGLAGAIVVPLNTRLTPPELAYILRDSGTSVLVHAPTHDTHAAELRAEVPHVLPRARSEELLAAAPTTPVDETVEPDDVAMIMYTSGTTGRPKGAALSHANVHWNSVNVLIDVDLAGDEVTLVNAPMFHVAALNQTVLPTMLKGGTVVLDSFDPVRTLETIARRRVTYLFGVPAMFQAVAGVPEWTDADLSSVRVISSGAAPMPVEMVNRLRALAPDAVVTEGYGLTEVTMAATLGPVHRSGTRKVGTVGVPVFDTEVRILSPEGTPVAAGERGEVCVRGPQVMAGYHNRPDATADVLVDGWLHTGDIGVLDEDGYLSIVDRIKDMLLYKGYNVYPRELEELLAAHDGVLAAAVVGKPDADVGELPVAFVVPNGPSVTADDLMTAVNEQVVAYKRLREVRLVDQIPVSAAGKILKRELRAQL